MNVYLVTVEHSDWEYESTYPLAVFDTLRRAKSYVKRAPVKNGKNDWYEITRLRMNEERRP